MCSSSEESRAPGEAVFSVSEGGLTRAQVKEAAVARTVLYEEVGRLLDDGAQLVDVLPEAEYSELHLAGARNIPLKRLDAATTADLDRARPVVVYCHDALWDLSPRAACRLEMLGFEQVFDYVTGKADWLARGLPTEGDRAGERRVGDVARQDVVTCGPSEPVGDVLRRVEPSTYGFALVVAEGDVLLGRLRRAALEDDGDVTAEAAMEPGPSTVRIDTALDELAQMLDRSGYGTAVVTTPEGVLAGIARREDLSGDWRHDVLASLERLEQPPYPAAAQNAS